jgi:hypothetical protein
VRIVQPQASYRASCSRSVIAAEAGIATKLALFRGVGAPVKEFGILEMRSVQITQLSSQPARASRRQVTADTKN